MDRKPHRSFDGSCALVTFFFMAIIYCPGAGADPIPADANLDLQATFSPSYSRSLFLSALWTHLGADQSEVTLLDGNLPVEFYFHGINKTVYSQTLYRTDSVTLQLYYNISSLHATVISGGSASGGGGGGNTGMYVGIVLGVIIFLVGFFLFCYFCKPCADSKNDETIKDRELLNSRVV